MAQATGTGLLNRKPWGLMQSLLLAGAVCSCAVTVPVSGDRKTGRRVSLSVGSAQVAAQVPAEVVEPETVEEAVDSYVVGSETHVAGGPTDVETDLKSSFPQKDSLLPGKIPAAWFDWKKQLYEDYGLAVAISYQMQYQHASATLTGTDNASGGWLLFEFGWTAINRGKDYEGNLIATFDWRFSVGGDAQPTFWGLQDVGSLWPTDFAFFDLGPAVPIFYWEQWFTKDRFVLRVGKQLAMQTYDFFRFKDARVAFSASALTAHTSIPSPAFGQAVSFKWWPKEGSELYVLGTLNDMNGDPERIGFDTFFELHQFFYGVEIGYFWRRSPGDFDHVHLNIFYADEKDTQAPGFPNEAGGGFKLLGSKQWGRWVAFGSYTYNTAEGGGFGATFGRHTVTAGVAYLKPAGIRGEIGFGAIWMDPLNDALRDQYGGELYWKMLLTPDFWLTPGMQLILDPSFNPDEDAIFIAQIKFRLFF